MLLLNLKIYTNKTQSNQDICYYAISSYTYEIYIKYLQYTIRNHLVFVKYWYIKLNSR